MEIYHIIRVENGLLFIRSEKYGQQIWVASRANRKPAGRLCQFCEEAISAGEETYRPMGNKSNRMDRVHSKCVAFEIKSAIGRHQLFPDIYPALEIDKPA